jgi:putative DNA methylase
MLNVLPPTLPSSKKKPDANLSGAANDFQALERLRKLAFAETVPAPKVPEQVLLELVEVDAGEDEEPTE